VIPSATCVALCNTIHDVMRAEKLLKARGIWLDLVPTPRELSSDCGMALALREEDLSAIREMLAADGLRTRIYRNSGAGYEQLR